MFFSDKAGDAGGDRYGEELERRASNIVDDANKDPKQALAAVMSLPDFHNARLRALVDLARAISKTAPGYSREALSEALKLAPAADEEFMQAQFLADIAKQYGELGDVDAMKDVVARGFKVAEKLYSEDSDASDPNQALKPTWPSAAVWRMFIALVNRTSTVSEMLNLIAKIPDPEIQSWERIAVGNTLVGAKPDIDMVMVRTTSKNKANIYLTHANNWRIFEP